MDEAVKTSSSFSFPPFSSGVCLFDPLCVCAQVVGLYRLCGSAAVKKELREAFERDSYGAALCENTYPDINVITGKRSGRDSYGKCMNEPLQPRTAM